MREYKGNTLYVTTNKEESVEFLLNKILNSLTGFVRSRHEMPKYVKMSYENYEAILKYNKTLIMKEENKYFILGMEVML